MTEYNLGHVVGEKGPQGDTGPQGPAGPKGDSGSDATATPLTDTVTQGDTTHAVTGCDVCIGASSEFTVSPPKSNYRIFIGNSGRGNTRYGYRTTSTINAGGSTSGEVSLNTTHNMKIVKEGTLFKYYLNDRLLGSKTITGFWANYHMFGVHTVQWNRGTTTISDLKIKQI